MYSLALRRQGVGTFARFSSSVRPWSFNSLLSCAYISFLGGQNLTEEKIRRDFEPHAKLVGVRYNLALSGLLYFRYRLFILSVTCSISDPLVGNRFHAFVDFLSEADAERTLLEVGKRCHNIR